MLSVCGGLFRRLEAIVKEVISIKNTLPLAAVLLKEEKAFARLQF